HCVACCVFYQCRLPSFLSRPPLRSTPFPYTTLFRSVAGYLGGHRRAVGKCTGQVRVSGEREEGNGHHGGGLMRQPLAAGGHAQLDEIFNGSGGVLVVGAECGSGGPALRGIAVSRLRAVSGSRSDVLGETSDGVIAVHVRNEFAVGIEQRRFFGSL